jgi:hypothetical protein
LISREAAVDFYATRARELGWKIPQDIIASLPPALCYWLLKGDEARPGIKGLSSAEEFALGFQCPEIERVGSVLLSVQGLETEIQASLPLHGHRPVAAPGILRWIHLALAELSDFAPEAYLFIQDWCSLVVWLEREPERRDVTELTSTSLPMLPFASFVSKKMIRHLPPKHIMPAVNYYGIQENLFHEALHHQLSAFIIQQAVLSKPPADAPKIPIPWRGVSWPIDRVLHAAWVYSGLQDLRRKRLANPVDDQAFNKALGTATEDGAVALEFLANCLMRNRSAFTGAGQAVIESLQPVPE